MNRRSFFASVAAPFSAKPILSAVPKDPKERVLMVVDGVRDLEYSGMPNDLEYLGIPNKVRKTIIFSSFGRSVFINGVLVEYDPIETYRGEIGRGYPCEK